MAVRVRWLLSSGNVVYYPSRAHIAQMVERVLGKDEVTSSILVVGSNRNANAVS